MRSPPAVPKQKSSVLRNRIVAFGKTLRNLKLIATDLPGLTLHDERHFEALWRRADQIAGCQYHLNPLELFVFGGSILLHDAGLTLGAYSGGLQALTQTVAWRDAVALKTQGLGSDAVPTTFADDADIQFEVLRQIHAAQAEELPELTLQLPDCSHTVHLLEDESLRRHLGPIIGQIAASHHWDLHAVEQRLPDAIGALADFPSTWTIRPIVLACLLRCADAAQVDQQRAPDFSYALLRGNRTSEKHWRAQNRISQPFVTGDALTFTSTRVFDKNDADAWWLIADALALAHRELEDCHRLLTDIGATPFAVRAVRDANAPDKLKEFIRVKGWEPVSISTRISNPTGVIELLGGSQLYEEKGLAVPLRELLQNATDAIRARRALEGPDETFGGYVDIRIEHCDESHKWLIVEDNGVGMSSRILTGPLIDFGISLWRSAMVKEVLPGLASKNVEQVGRYGIGFYSVMMVSNYITVSSRPYTAGLESIKTIQFTNGLLNHGVLISGSTPSMGTNISTRIKLKVKNEIIDEFCKVVTGSAFYKRNQRNEDDGPTISFDQRVAVLAVGVDCDVYTKHGDGPRLLSHSASWRAMEPLRWLERVLLASLRERALEVAAITLRDVTDQSKFYGRAAISFWSFQGAELTVVGGFAVGTPSIAWEGAMSRLFGFISSTSAGPRRHRGNYVPSPEALMRWASEQATLLAQANLSPAEAHDAAESVASFGGNIMPLANVMVNGELLPVEGLSALLLEGYTAIMPIRKHQFVGPYEMLDSVNDGTGIHNSRRFIEINSAIKYLVEGKSIPSGMYYAVDKAVLDDKSSIIGCLNRHLQNNGYIMNITYYDEFEVGKYIGPDIPEDQHWFGEVILRRVAEISARLALDKGI
jgi:hypothetical protein